MSLQYIGARYVPTFYDNPDTHDMTWKSGIGYEPLTVVKYNSDTYTSKKPVPSNIGNPADNGVYWAKTADYNAALVALQNQVNNIDNVELPQIRDDINALPTKRRFVLIGDSFGYGVVGGGNPRGTGWLDGFAQNMPSDTVFYLNDAEVGALEGVAGFCSTLPFIDILEEIYNTKFTGNVTPSEITDIVVLGGSNDYGVGATLAQLDVAIKAFITYANSHFPNAKIKIGILAKRIHDISINGIATGYSQCMKYNAEYIADTLGLCVIPQYYSADGTHLTAEGYTFYQRYINQAIVSGRCVYNFQFKVTATIDNTVISTPPTVTAWIDHNNHATKVAFSYANDTYKEWPIAYITPAVNGTAFSDFITLDTAVEFPKRYQSGGEWLNLCEITADGKKVVNPCQHAFYFVSDKTHFGFNVGNSATSTTGIDRMLTQIDPSAAQYVEYSPF